MLRFFPAAPSRRAFLLLGLLVLGALAAGAFWRVQAAAGAAPAPVGGEAILLKLANTAMREHRLVAPVGSNVYEFYFSVLQLDPHNAEAQSALHDAFKPSCAVVERSIDRGDLDEAQRELNLLRQYAPDDYTLLLLGGKLGEHRAMQARQHEQEAERIRMQAEAGGAGAATG
jgi:protein TonB